MENIQSDFDIDIEAIHQGGHEANVAEQENIIGLTIHHNADDYPELNLFERLPSIDFTHAPTPDVLARDMLSGHHQTADPSYFSLMEPLADIDPEEIMKQLIVPGELEEDILCSGAPCPEDDVWMNANCAPNDNTTEKDNLLDIPAPFCQEGKTFDTGGPFVELASTQPSEVGKFVGDRRDCNHALDARTGSPPKWPPMSEMHHHQRLLYQQHLLTNTPSIIAKGDRPGVCAEPHLHQISMPAIDVPQPEFNDAVEFSSPAPTNDVLGSIGCNKGNPKTSSQVISSPQCSSGAEKMIKKMRREPKTQNRYTKGASSSHYCHICGRKSKIEFGRCQNVKLGLCRKVICEKCLLLYEPESLKRALSNNGTWTCTHCRSECPDVARCKQYAKINQKRREKKARERAGRPVAQAKATSAIVATAVASWSATNPTVPYLSGTVNEALSASSLATTPVTGANSTANNPLGAGLSRTPSANSEPSYIRNLALSCFGPPTIPN